MWRWVGVLACLRCVVLVVLVRGGERTVGLPMVEPLSIAKRISKVRKVRATKVFNNLKTLQKEWEWVCFVVYFIINLQLNPC